MKALSPQAGKAPVATAPGRGLLWNAAPATLVNTRVSARSGRLAPGTLRYSLHPNSGCPRGDPGGFLPVVVRRMGTTTYCIIVPSPY